MNSETLTLYASYFETQLSEIEMIQSMYSNRGEFEMDDPSVMADMRTVVEGKSTILPESRLQFTVNLKLDKGTFAVISTLPFDYPEVKPEVYVRSPELNRCSQGNLNQALTTVISGLPKGDLCIGFALDWLRDEGVSYLGCQETDKMPPSTGEIDTSSALNRFVRFWIYSHHIYNKSKRRSILEMARSADLTGFCLPGKPGVICVEGTEADCEDFWYRIRQVPWKRIVCLKKEVEEEEEHKTVENHKQLRRFQKFEEVHFEVAKSNGRDFKMDMGAFYGFLEQHHCGYVFKDYFGIEGKNK